MTNAAVHPGPKGKVLVAMSGGVDSSVAAALLKQKGYDVVGCFMRLGSPGETLDTPLPAEEACRTSAAKIGHQGCCSVGDAADARLVAAKLGIPLYVCNFKKDFGRIIDYFVDEYAQGRTPNPCVRCNDWLKFGKLHEYALQMGASHVASGHYARVDRGRLMRGIDPKKDQSYVLFGMPRAQLAHTLLPVGGMPKAQVRELAKEFGLPVFNKPDSQEICFVPGRDYAAFVEERRPDLAAPGRIVDEAGREIGTHGGQHRFTIGQRRGLDIALGHRVYVVGKDVASNTVTIGGGRRLQALGCAAGEANWLADVPGAGEWFPAWAKYRSNSPAVRASVRVGAESGQSTHSGRSGTFEVRFDEPQTAVAAGQAIVLYSDAEPEVVLGGGWIGAVHACEAGATPEPSALSS